MNIPMAGACIMPAAKDYGPMALNCWAPGDGDINVWNRYEIKATN
jgi:hypothetical protein